MTTGPASRATGGADATAVWLQRYGAALRRYFRRRVASTDVDDHVQEVFLRLQKAAVTSDVSGAEGYLFTVARNVLIDRHRLERTRDRDAYATFARIGGLEDRLSPERILLAREEYTRVRRAIMNLPPRARAAFEFHRFEHMTYAEIAATMRISPDAVKKLVHRALLGVTAQVFGAETRDD